MASSKRPDSKKVAHDPIVGRVLGEKHKPVGGLVCIGGFVGESPRPECVRLFTKMDFSECLDIPESAIVGHEKVQKPGFPDATYIWVKRNSRMQSSFWPDRRAACSRHDDGYASVRRQNDSMSALNSSLSPSRLPIRAPLRP